MTENPSENSVFPSKNQESGQKQKLQTKNTPKKPPIVNVASISGNCGIAWSWFQKDLASWRIVSGTEVGAY